jgi:NAD(P)-dependent dehydrogenase (short-subunit alcohol dehydrogenase family)
MSLVKGHNIVAIGAGSGLGRGVARRMVESAARLTILEISAEKAASLEEEFGDAVVVVTGDACSLADLEACLAAHVSRFGTVDALICFQGVWDGNVPLAQIDPVKVGELFDELFRINVKSCVLAARVFGEALRDGGGALVLTTSNAAYAADGGGACYSATKGALRSLVGQLAFEFAPTVRVNAVAPAAIGKSELRGPAALGMDGFKQSDIPADLMIAGYRKLSLIDAYPRPEDYFDLYAFLASRANKVMTGQTMVAEQGLLNRVFLSEK